MLALCVGVVAIIVPAVASVSSADWAIGPLVGIDLIFAGWGLLAVAGVGKRLAAT